MVQKKLKDYYALQQAWQICVNRYLSTTDKIERVAIINDLAHSLINIKDSGNMALRTTYEQWEKKEWEPENRRILEQIKIINEFESEDPNFLDDEYFKIQQERNYLRYKKIMQIIQDSGIGLGAKKERGHYELSGYVGELTE